MTELAAGLSFEAFWSWVYRGTCRSFPFSLPQPAFIDESPFREVRSHSSENRDDKINAVYAACLICSDENLVKLEELEELESTSKLVEAGGDLRRCKVSHFLTRVTGLSLSQFEAMI